MVLSEVISIVEYRLQQTDVKGFPIVSADDRFLLLGYIGRNELRYIIGSYYLFLFCTPTNAIVLPDRAKRSFGTTPETPCSFYSMPTDHDRDELSTLETGPAVASDDETFARVIHQHASPEKLELWPWVNRVRRYVA